MLLYTSVITIAFLIALVLWGRSTTRTSEMLRKMVATDLTAGKVGRDNTKLLKQIREAEDTIARNNYLHGLDLVDLNDTKKILQEDLREARKVAREATNKLTDYLLSDILSIKFTANIPQKGWTKTEFKLGVGSCGKEVTALHWTEKDDRYDLRQTCADGERKEFTYFKEDVAGRIEMAYAAIKPTL